MVDAPTSIMHTDCFAALAQEVGEEVGATHTTVIHGEALRDRGFGGLWGYASLPCLLYAYYACLAPLRSYILTLTLSLCPSVGKASEHLPSLVVLEHRPDGVAADAPAVVTVGKGIVYDTGGLSIKTKTGMPGMKRDMGGAAAVLGAFHAVAGGGGCGGRYIAILCLGACLTWLAWLQQ